MDILSLGEKIKRLRKEKDLTLKDLAGDRITPGQISLVESGKSNPSMDLLEYIATFLGTSVEYLMESEETQGEKICAYFENMAEAYILSKHYEAAEKYIQSSMHYAEEYNLEFRRAKAYYLKGFINFEKNDFNLAQQFFLSANSIFIKINAYEEIIITFLKLGIITYKLMAYHSSITYFKQAEKIFLDINSGNDLLKGKIYFYLAKVSFKLDFVENAMNYSFLATEKFKQIDNKPEYANSLVLISKEYMNKKDLDNAIKYSDKALKIFKEINDVCQISNIENDLGKLYYEFDNLDESFIHYSRAKEIRNKNDKSKFIETLISICENYIKNKNTEKCQEIISEINLNIEFINDDNMVKFYLLKYRVCLLQGDDNGAENNLIMAQSYAQNRYMNLEYAQISIVIGNYYIDKGQESEAANYLNVGVNMFKKLGILKEL